MSAACASDGGHAMCNAAAPARPRHEQVRSIGRDTIASRTRTRGVASLHRAFAEIMCERRALRTACIDISHAVPRGIEPRTVRTPIAIAGRHIVQKRIEPALRHVGIALKIPGTIEQRRRHDAFPGRSRDIVAERRKSLAERPTDRGEIIGSVKIGRWIEGHSVADVIEQRIADRQDRISPRYQAGSNSRWGFRPRAAPIAR